MRQLASKRRNLPQYADEEEESKGEEKAEPKPYPLLPTLPQVDMTQVLEKLDILIATIYSHFDGLEKLVDEHGKVGRG